MRKKANKWRKNAMRNEGFINAFGEDAVDAKKGFKKGGAGRLLERIFKGRKEISLGKFLIDDIVNE